MKDFFSLEGRIDRSEYFISLIVFLICLKVINEIISVNDNLSFFELLFIPLFWMIIAQGTKRCHDIGQHGWLQIIPFYVFLLVFKKGQLGVNKFQLDSKETDEESNLLDKNLL
ncbi:MAG: DUF805 domain-containing protein [Chitinophagales bacterium]|nr:DUF805 domain-containing protein [Chitinophagales bacterium]